MKLLFVCNNMHMGGVQRSLVNLLRQISEEHDVSLFLFYPTGSLMGSIPPSVKVIGANRFVSLMGTAQHESKEKGTLTMLRRSFWVIVTKIFGTRASFGALSRMQKLNEKYDAAISFMQNSDDKTFYGGCNEFVINSVSAAKKISFVHCDFKNYFGNNKYNRDYYKHFDRIACVSGSCKRVFDEVCPQYEDKTFTVHNCFDLADMEKKRDEYEAEYTPGVLNIFTAARVSEEKGIFRVLPALAKMKAGGKRFVWRVAGAGPLLGRAIEETEKYGLADCVKFLGMLDNPYPYFAKSDMLLVPSYDEAAPMVYGEAAYFGLPILTTDTTSAREMVEAHGLGIVCANDDAATARTEKSGFVRVALQTVFRENKDNERRSNRRI